MCSTNVDKYLSKKLKFLSIKTSDVLLPGFQFYFTFTFTFKTLL